MTILHNRCVAKQHLHVVNMMNHGVQCFNFAVYYIHTPFMTHADNVHMPHHINLLALSPGHSQILYRSRGEKLYFLHSCKIKSGSGLGMRLSIYYVRNRGPHHVTETIFQGPGTLTHFSRESYDFVRPSLDSFKTGISCEV